MKLQAIKRSIQEKIENIGQKDPLEWGDTFKPMTYTNFNAVASVSYADAIEAVTRWRKAANEKVAERRKIALEAADADDEDRFNHMSSKQEKFNKGEKITLDESLSEEIIHVSDEADKLLVKLALAGFHDWQQLALDLLDSMADEQVQQFVDDYDYEVITSGVQFEEDKPITESVEDIAHYDADNLEEFQPWQGAVRIWQAIQDAGKMDIFKELISELYPDTIDGQTLNDLLWFDSDFIFTSLGMEDPLDAEVPQDNEEGQEDVEQ